VSSPARGTGATWPPPSARYAPASPLFIDFKIWVDNFGQMSYLIALANFYCYVVIECCAIEDRGDQAWRERLHGNSPPRRNS
jgi:hypothetical protein